MEISEFIKKLSSSDFLEALQWFNHFWESAPSNRAKAIQELLLLCPDCQPIFAILNKKKAFGKILCQAVFDAVGNVLFSILTECPEQVSHVEGITKVLFGQYSKCLSAVFELKCSGSVLRCITASVMAGEESANIVIDSMDWSLMEIAAQQRDSSVAIDSRSWCVYLYTAILNLQNSQLTECFFRSGALPLIFKGLNLDPCERVVAIIKALHEKILLNPKIKGGVKVHLFNRLTLVPILKINKWTGPKKNKKSVPDDDDDEENDLGVDDVEQLLAGREKIIDAQCAFLKTLCSSYNHGIAVRATMDYKPHNGHVLNLITQLPISSFVDSRYRSLIMESLVACPDIRVQYAKSMRAQLIIGPDKYFMGFVKMYEELIERTNAEALAHRSIEAITRFLLPVPVSGYFVSLLLHHASKDVRLKVSGISLMLSVLVMGNRVLKAIQKESSLTPASKLKNILVAFVKEAVPDLQFVVDVWNEIMDGPEVEGRSESLLVIVKFLALYSRFQPSELQKTIKPDQMLEQVQQLKDWKEDHRLPLLIACLQLATSLQSKFDAFSLAQNSSTKSELFNSFKMLFKIYLESVSVVEDEIARKEKILVPLLEHIETSLINYGFSDQGESNIQLWLEELMGRGPECLDFLCSSIVSTIASLEHFSDKVVVITSNSTTDEYFDFTRMLQQYPIELLVKDSTDISVSNVNLSFSRLILGSLEVIPTIADEDRTQVLGYFSVVIQRYVCKLQDPQVLVKYLMTETEIELPEPLVQLCRCWLGKKPKTPVVNKDGGDSFADKLASIFFTKSYSTVDSLVVETALSESLNERKNLLLSLLMYIKADTCEGSSVVSKASPAYAKILDHVMRSTVSDFKEEASKLGIFSIALDHAALISRYDPFSSDPLQCMPTQLLTELYQEKTSNLKIIIPYFKKACDKLNSRIMSKDECVDDVDYALPFTPFFLDPTLLAHSSLVGLLEITSSASEEFYSNETFVELASKTVCALKAQCSSVSTADQRSLHQLTKRYLTSLCHLVTGASEEASPSVVSFLKNLQGLMSVTMLPVDVQSLDKDMLKWIFTLSKALGGEVLLRILELHPPHSSYIAKRLKKSSPVFPAHASLLLYLCYPNKDDSSLTSSSSDLVSAEFTTAMMAEAKPFVIEWLKDYDAIYEPGYVGLATKLIKAGHIGPADAVSIVKAIYPRLIEGGNPPLHLSSVCSVCLTLKGHKKESKLPNPDALLSAVHMVLCCFERCCYRALKDKLKPDQRQTLADMVLLLKDLAPMLLRRSREAKADATLWMKAMKKTLRSCLRCNNSHVEESASLLKSVGELCQWQCGGHENAEQVVEVVKLLVNHPRFQEIMAQTELDEPLLLKESVLELLCVLHKLCPAAALQYPASRLLVAYDGTTRLTDQIALQLLKQYEDSGFMEDLLPVVWGSSASRYFRASGNAVVFKEPKPEHVIENIDLKILVNTCLNFDVFMSCRPDVRCREPAESKGTVYDLRFLLPILIYVTRRFMDAKTRPALQVLSVLVSVGIATLSAQDRSIRGMGATLLSALTKLVVDVTPESVRLYWTWLLNIARYTAASSAAATKSSLEKLMERRPRFLPKVNSEHDSVQDITNQSGTSIDVSSIPLPGPMCRFLVETTLCTDHPDHPVFAALMNYTFLFPRLKPQTFPEMQRLFNSTSISESVHDRLLFLRLISEGIKTEDDFVFLEAAKGPMHVIALMHSVTVPPVLLLDVMAALEAMCNTPYGANRILRYHEVLHLLPGMLERTSTYPTIKRSLVKATVETLNTAWHTLTHAENFQTRRKALLHIEGGTQVRARAEEEEEEEGYYEEDDEYQYYQEEVGDDEEKSKLKKKRKLEAKKKAAKKMKQNDGTVMNMMPEETAVASKRHIDVFFLSDFMRCLSDIVVDIYESMNTSAIEKFEKLTESVTKHAKKYDQSTSPFVEFLVDFSLKPLKEYGSQSRNKL
ncbi:Nucleolar pre-ribosomal-associated protein 1 C-terminal domain [Trinorchestia longiramus]|nr:Nucleolar pre-ribosomal-associated protein 1 C-terminal domain [Trinorchestia longiramus]